MTDGPTFHQIRDCVIDLLNQAQFNLMRSADLRQDVTESLGVEIHPMKFYGSLVSMEQVGLVQYMNVRVMSSDGTSDEDSYYRILK